MRTRPAAITPATVCPRIDAGRIILEPLTEAHAPSLYLLLRDPEVWQFTEQAPPVDVAALQARYRRLATRSSPDRTQWWLNWAIVLAGAGPIGFVQATLPADAATADIAYTLGRAYRSRGVATDAVAAMLAFLASALGVGHFTACVDERNAPSCALLTRLGFARIATNDPRNVRWARRELPPE